MISINKYSHFLYFIKLLRQFFLIIGANYRINLVNAVFNVEIFPILKKVTEIYGRSLCLKKKPG
jgi:hypothetical protein